jgi:hypothetical protein
MPKLERWIVAQKMVEVIDGEMLKDLINLGVHIGGGWAQVHQHIMVNSSNKETVERMLRDKGYEVLETSEACHPEVHGPH